MEQVECPTCSARIGVDARFCNNCGAQLMGGTLTALRSQPSQPGFQQPMMPAAPAGYAVAQAPQMVQPIAQQPVYQQPQPIAAQPQPYYQGPVQQVQVVMAPSQATTVMVVNKKSVGVALLLTFLFGPLGMFYSTVGGAITMLVVSVVFALLTAGISVLITWPICMIWAAVAANK